MELLPSQSVSPSVWKVYCGETADWIWMPFGVVRGVGREMGVLAQNCPFPFGNCHFYIVLMGTLRVIILS